MSLVPYAGRYAVKRSIGHLAIPASRAAKYARNNYIPYRLAGELARGATRMAARRIQRSYRRFKRRTRGRKKPMRKRMQPSSKSNSKAHQDTPVIGGENQNFPMGSLQLQRMPEPPPPNDPAAFNARERANVFYKGYKICRYFENTFNTSEHVYEVHHALVQWNNQRLNELLDRAAAESTIENQVTLEDLVQERFFRDLSDQQTRATNFGQYVSGDSWRMKMNCLPMNPDRGYRIIWHKKKTLFPRNVSQSSRRYYWKIDKYIKVNKMMTFKDRDAVFSNTPMFEVYWYNQVTPTFFPAEPQQVNAIRTIVMNKLYFK